LKVTVKKETRLHDVSTQFPRITRPQQPDPIGGKRTTDREKPKEEKKQEKRKKKREAGKKAF